MSKTITTTCGILIGIGAGCFVAAWAGFLGAPVCVVVALGLAASYVGRPISAYLAREF